MSFGDFPEQQPVVSLLQKSLAAGRLGHAYLFSGEDLGLMEALAGTLAKTLNCLHPPRRSPGAGAGAGTGVGVGGQGLDCCGSCLNCRRIANGNHPDVQWVRPESKLRAITIDQIREVIQVLSLKPAEAEYKVAIVVAADRMNVQAANAFLKTLEEPSPRSVLILLTCALEQVLETILSRCLRLHFAGGAGARLDEEVQAWLASLATAAAAPQKSLLGRYQLLGLITQRLALLRGRAEQQLEAASPLARYPDAEKGLRERWESELNAAIEAEYRRRRFELLLLLQWWMRDIWLAALQVPESLFALPQARELTVQVAGRVAPAEAAANLGQLEHLQKLLMTNVQESLALEVSLLKMRL